MAWYKYNSWTLPGLPANWNQVTHRYAVVLRSRESGAVECFQLLVSSLPFVVKVVNGTQVIAFPCESSVYNSFWFTENEQWWDLSEVELEHAENCQFHYVAASTNDSGLSYDWAWCNESIRDDSNNVVYPGSVPVLIKEPEPEPEPEAYDRQNFLNGLAAALCSKARAFPKREPVAYPVLAERDTWYKGSTPRYTFTEINIVDSYTPTGDETESWEADVDETGSIMCYVNGKILTMAGNGHGRIKLSADASSTFSGEYGNRFGNVIDINGLNILDTSDVTDMSGMFYDCGNLSSLDLRNFDTSNVTDMSSMFLLAFSMTSVDLSSFDTRKVTDMSQMFSNANSLASLDLSSFDTSNVTNMYRMFEWCADLTSIDLSSFNTANVTQMQCMFEYCRSLTTLDLRSFDTRNVKTQGMNETFASCTNLTSILVGDNWAETGYVSNTFRNCGVSSVTYV